MTSDWFLFLILLQPPVFGHLIVTPLNQVSMVGSRVAFHCQTNISKPITWSRTQVGRQLSVNIRNRDGYSISSNDSRNYYFTIDSVTLEDAGVQAWNDNDGFGTAFGIILVVIHEGLSCVTNVTHEGVADGNAILIVCSVAYRGNMKAMGHWIDPSGTRITASEDEISSSINDTKVFRRLVTVDVAQGKRPLYRFYLSFTVKDKNRPNFAANDPDENYSWTSPEVNVLFPVSNIEVNVTGEDDPTVAYLGETVTCSAEGNPEVQFHWEELDVVRSGEDRSIVTGPHLTLNASGRHRYRCIAQNTVRNELHRLTSKNISVNVLPRIIQSTSSQSVNSRTDVGGVTCCVASSAGVKRSLAPESSENRSTLHSANSSVIHWISSDASTERMNPLSESTLFFLTLAMGSALIVGIVASVVCLVVSKMRKRRRLVRLAASEDHYLTVVRNTSGEGKFADDLGCHKDQQHYGYTECRKSDIYEEINDSEVIDGSVQRPGVHLGEQCQWKMSPKSTARHENSADDEEIIAMESSYITCPATLPASDSVSNSSPLYIDVCM